jgi:hypothetical protein
MFRACASSSASVCSAALMTFDCGAFTTITPRRVASSTSTLSRPIPARAITLRLAAAASTSPVTWVALRMTNASYGAISAARSPFASSGRTSTWKSFVSRSSPCWDRDSVTSTRIGQAAPWNTCSAAPTAAPSFTGKPRRARVISSAARPLTMSSSLK